jgi:hypothetical protein
MSLGLVETGSDGTRAHLVPVIIGQDDGATAQIASGVSANDRIIQDPPDSLIDGERVTVVNPGNASNVGGK